MNKNKFPLIAILLGAPLLAALIGLDENLLPLMTRLFMSEFGAVLSGFGAYFGIRSIMGNGFTALTAIAIVICLLMAIKFSVIGFGLWPS